VNTEINWRIPSSVRKWLEEVPQDRPVALLLRHSVRDDLLSGHAGYVQPLTKVGVGLAHTLGMLMGGRLRTLHASPLVRTVQTAEALRDGAGEAVSVVEDRLLGDPGVFVVDGRRAGEMWEELQHEAVMARLVSEDEAMPGMARPGPGARFLVQHMLTVAGSTPGLHVFVTHDSLVTATAARLLRKPLGPEDWPFYLEGVFFWRDERGIQVAYQNVLELCGPWPLCKLQEEDVIELARREIGRTLGFDSGARFFLAGGAFKSLLTGQPPRDLDLWAPSAQDRERLVATLLERGAQQVAGASFSDAFKIAGRVVDLPHKVEPARLTERLARFDVALSAVGVEHRPGDEWSAEIHPLALESVKRREVLLLKPLVNWKYALATLERMRRYGKELNFRVPPEEESEVWRVFGAQSPTMQAGMMERFQRTAVGGFLVEEEASQFVALNSDLVSGPLD